MQLVPSKWKRFERYLPGTQPTHLTANNNTNETLAAVRNGYYSHILLSPEIAFRESYTHLKYLRNVLGHKPWFGCTATLDIQSFESLCYSSGFSKNVRIMRTTINRPEIAIIRKELPQKSKFSFRMLYFLFDEATEQAQ